MYCAVNSDRRVRITDIANACNASENHLGQVIGLLRQSGFIDAVRGRNGGLSLSRPANLINIGAVFRIFEADMPFAECFGPDNTCPLVKVCWLRIAIADAVETFYGSLERVNLSDLVDGNDALQLLLGLPQDVRTPPPCGSAQPLGEGGLSRSAVV